MGIFKLLPGHNEGRNLGIFSYEGPDEFIKSDDKEKIDIGNFGQFYKIDTEGDKPAAHYSIPNPWASAILFNQVLSRSNHDHPLQNKIIELLLNILNDYHCLGKLRVVKYTQSADDSPFKLFWKMAPEYLIYDDGNRKCMYFFMNNNDEIVGGISKTTLVWTSQMYIPPSNLSKLKSNVKIKNYLAKINDLGEPLENSKFWNIPTILNMLGESEVDRLIDDPVFQDSWLKTIDMGKIVPESKYNLGGYFIFDKKALNDPNIIGEGCSIPEGFIEALTNQKKGDELPLQQGKGKWILFDQLFEDKWVRMTSMDNSDPKRHNFTYYKSYLYPVRPEYFNFGLKLNMINKIPVKDLDSKSTAILPVSLKVKNKNNEDITLTHSLALDTVDESRNIAVWPSFKSTILPTHIYEQLSKKIKGKKNLEYYDDHGDILSSTNISETESHRINRLNGINDFPRYIQVNSSSGGSGFLNIKPKVIKNLEKDQVVSIDFGSTHTNIGYGIHVKEKESKDPKFELLTFDESKPIIIWDKKNFEPFRNFIPYTLLNEPPTVFDEYNTNQYNWTPFRTQWIRFSEKEPSFLESGVATLGYKPENFGRNIIGNLKWDTESHDRNGFLNYILTLVLVECEKRGVKNLVIRYAFPFAFSEPERKVMTKFYESIKSKKRFKECSIKITVEKPKSEAVSTLNYFIKDGKLDIRSHSASIDIGGGTTDIAVLHNEDILLQDSLKFGGDVLESIKFPKIISIFNERREFRNLSELPSYSTFCDYVRLWPGVNDTWDGKLDDFIVDKTDRTPFLKATTIFYSSIFFYVGLQLRNAGIDLPLSNICCAGGGTQYLRIPSNYLDLDEECIPEWIELFRKMVSKGQGVELNNYDQTTIHFTNYPKQEVARGLVYANTELFNKSKQKIVRLLGLSVKDGNNNLPWNTNLEDKVMKDISSLDISKMEIDFDNLEEFLDVYFKVINNTDKDSHFNGIIDKSWPISLDHKFKREVSRRLTNRKHLAPAAPIFFTALQVWLDGFMKNGK